LSWAKVEWAANVAARINVAMAMIPNLLVMVYLLHESGCLLSFHEPHHSG
jgi:hypothetical protein